MVSHFENPSALKTIFDMYLKSDFADVYFTFPHDDRNEKLPAHRNILASTSPVFATMLYGSAKEGNVVKIDDSNAGAFKEFLQFFYLPVITLTMENIAEVVRLAIKFDMLDHLDVCASFLESQLTTENAATVYQLALSLKDGKLIEICEKCIQLFTKGVLKSDAFLKSGEEVIKRILILGKSKCSEYDLFDACMKWARRSCRINGLDETPVNLKLGHCFHLIRSGEMDEKGVDKILSNEIYEDIFGLDELPDIIRTKPSTLLNKTIDRIGRFISFHAGFNQYCLKGRESVWFSISERVLLKGITFHFVKSKNRPCTLFSSSGVEIQILEYSAKTLNKNAYSKVLRTISGDCIERNSILNLTIPVFISPEKIYEIRTDNVPNDFYYTESHSTKIRNNLSDKITVTLHQDPANSGRTRRHLVSGLKLIHL